MTAQSTEKQNSDDRLSELIDDPLLLVDLIPQAGELLVMETLRLSLLTKGFLEVERASVLKDADRCRSVKKENKTAQCFLSMHKRAK